MYIGATVLTTSDNASCFHLHKTKRNFVPTVRQRGSDINENGNTIGRENFDRMNSMSNQQSEKIAAQPIKFLS